MASEASSSSATTATSSKRASLRVNKENKEVLLDRLGGEAALKAAVYEFYGRILADPALAPFFETTNMAHLRDHQYKFMALAFTAIPDDVNVAQLLAEKHERLFAKGLNETHFDLVAGHLVASLEHLQVAKPLIEEVVSVVGPLRSVFEENAKKNGEQALLDRLGGPSALKATVYEFYSRIMEDEELTPFFENANMKRLKEHQYKFMELAFTEIPADLDVIDYLGKKHQHLFNKGLNARHFDLVAGHLVATLKHLEVKQEIIDDVVATVGPLRVVFDK